MLSKTLYGNYLEPETEVEVAFEDQMPQAPDEERVVLLLEDDAPDEFFNGIGEYLDYDEMEL